MLLDGIAIFQDYKGPKEFLCEPQLERTSTGRIECVLVEDAAHAKASSKEMA
jgi:hypothetical protein